MKKTVKIASLLAIVVVIASVTFTGYLAFRAERYRTAFSQIGAGETKQTVIDLMGKPSEIRGCRSRIGDANRPDDAVCSEVLVYGALYESWAFAIDKNGEVVKRYYWFLGEYGDRPPNAHLRSASPN